MTRSLRSPRHLGLFLAAVCLVLPPLLFPAPGFAFPNSYDYTRQWHTLLGVGEEVPLVGDFNADTRDEVAIFVRDTKPEPDRGSCSVAVSTGRAFGNPTRWGDHLCFGQETPAVGDFDADGKVDVCVFVADNRTGRAAGEVYVARSDGSRFGAPTRWGTGFGTGAVLRLVGDFNGDRRSDLVYFVRNSQPYPADGDVYVALNEGGRFGAPRKWHDYFCVGTEAPLVGDFDGDRTDEIATVLRDGRYRGTIYVAHAEGDHFGASRVWAIGAPLGTASPILRIGDPNSDGKRDLIFFQRGRRNTSLGANDPAGDVYTMLSDGSNFGRPVRRHSNFCLGEEIPFTGDFEGYTGELRPDRPMPNDIVTFVRNTQPEPGRGDVYVALSTFGMSSTWRFRARQFQIVTKNESSGDDPYFVTFGMVSRPGHAGSTQIVWQGGLGAVGDDLGTGAIGNIPAGQGEAVVHVPPLPTKAELAAGAIPNVVVFAVGAHEHDWNSWDTISQKVNESKGVARRYLEGGVEQRTWRTLGPTHLFCAARSVLWLGETRLIGAGGFSDDDDPVGMVDVYFLAADPEVDTLSLTAVSEGTMQIGGSIAFQVPPLAERHVGLTEPLARHSSCGDNGTYRLSYDLTADPPPAGR